ncbi:MAG: hypothetical protein Q9168_002388 [Polycauliona sp. 1 TL-2023]
MHWKRSEALDRSKATNPATVLGDTIPAGQLNPAGHPNPGHEPVFDTSNKENELPSPEISFLRLENARLKQEVEYDLKLLIAPMPQAQQLCWGDTIKIDASTHVTSLQPFAVIEHRRSLRGTHDLLAICFYGLSFES